MIAAAATAEHCPRRRLSDNSHGGMMMAAGRCQCRCHSFQCTSMPERYRHGQGLAATRQYRRAAFYRRIGRAAASRQLGHVVLRTRLPDLRATI